MACRVATQLKKLHKPILSKSRQQQRKMIQGYKCYPGKEGGCLPASSPCKTRQIITSLFAAVLVRGEVAKSENFRNCRREEIICVRGIGLQDRYCLLSLTSRFKNCCLLPAACCLLSGNIFINKMIVRVSAPLLLLPTPNTFRLSEEICQIYRRDQRPFRVNIVRMFPVCGEEVRCWSDKCLAGAVDGVMRLNCGEHICCWPGLGWQDPANPPHPVDPPHPVRSRR